MKEFFDEFGLVVMQNKCFVKKHKHVMVVIGKHRLQPHKF